MVVTRGIRMLILLLKYILWLGSFIFNTVQPISGPLLSISLMNCHLLMWITICVWILLFFFRLNALTKALRLSPSHLQGLYLQKELPCHSSPTPPPRLDVSPFALKGIRFTQIGFESYSPPGELDVIETPVRLFIARQTGSQTGLCLHFDKSAGPTPDPGNFFYTTYVTRSSCRGTFFCCK